MKTVKFFTLTFILLLTSLFFSACSDDDNNDNNDNIEKVHYDIWVSVGESSGMGKDGASIVKSVNSLEVDTTIDFNNQGCDVTATLDDEIIFKGQYYYQAAPLGKARFGKYAISKDELQTIAERPFATNTYKDRRYTHTWISDHTLVIMAANGDANEVIWTKLNTQTMEILAEGNLGLAEKTGITKFSTSGLARYRKSDNKIIYAFQDKNITTSFFVAFINANDMNIEKIVEEDRAEQMAGTAYGELLQNKMFFDDNENLYIAFNSRIPNSEKSTCQFGRLLRIKKGATEFDTNYEGFKSTEDKGKLVTVDYLGKNKALLYIQDPEHTGTSTDNAKYAGWGDAYNCYYAMLDLTTDEVTEFKYNGTVLPYSSGTFSQRSFVLNGKAYIGVNPENSAPVIYIYNVNSGKMDKGLTIKEGYEFNRIVYITD